MLSFALKVAAISAALMIVLGGSAAIASGPRGAAPRARVHGPAWGGPAGIAYGPYNGIGYGYGLYGGWWPDLSLQDDQPYFALYPPVYYSHPVPRPYGFSPYAYPPGTMTPEAIRVQPLMVFNPFVAPSAATGPSATMAGPLRIRNPYVDQPETGLAAFDGLAGLPASKPQIVYPERAR
jgi:hypothetical protein